MQEQKTYKVVIYLRMARENDDKVDDSASMESMADMFAEVVAGNGNGLIKEISNIRYRQHGISDSKKK